MACTYRPEPMLDDTQPPTFKPDKKVIGYKLIKEYPDHPGKLGQFLRDHHDNKRYSLIPRSCRWIDEDTMKRYTEFFEPVYENDNAEHNKRIEIIIDYQQHTIRNCQHTIGELLKLKKL
jgi:hypothetical protein